MNEIDDNEYGEISQKALDSFIEENPSVLGEDEERGPASQVESQPESEYGEISQKALDSFIEENPSVLGEAGERSPDKIQEAISSTEKEDKGEKQKSLQNEATTNLNNLSGAEGTRSFISSNPKRIREIATNKKMVENMGYGERVSRSISLGSKESDANSKISRLLQGPLFGGLGDIDAEDYEKLQELKKQRDSYANARKGLELNWVSGVPGGMATQIHNFKMMFQDMGIGVGIGGGIGGGIIRSL